MKNWLTFDFFGGGLLILACCACVIFCLQNAQPSYYIDKSWREIDADYINSGNMRVKSLTITNDNNDVILRISGESKSVSVSVDGQEVLIPLSTFVSEAQRLSVLDK